MGKGAYRWRKKGSMCRGFQNAQMLGQQHEKCHCHSPFSFLCAPNARKKNKKLGFERSVPIRKQTKHGKKRKVDPFLCPCTGGGCQRETSRRDSIGKSLAHRNRSNFCDLRLRCPSRTPEIAAISERRESNGALRFKGAMESR